MLGGKGQIKMQKTQNMTFSKACYFGNILFCQFLDSDHCDVV